MSKSRFILGSLAILLVFASHSLAEKSGSKRPLKTNDAQIAEVDQMLETARAAITARANEQINWQVIASGGTDGSSTNYALKGTAGQLTVGSGSSPNYGLNHGYWQNFTTGSGGCCVGIAGNVDDDPGDVIDISDLVYLVDFMFSGGPEPPCFEEGDVDGSGSPPIDISDLVYLVDYMFTGGPPPPPCA
ncbi:MAG: hypothetical protein OEV49_03445 [candidate division Zixibacteria bacterium]|nr:hypothetical protein [candidate division Zixibacteria bacterium]MDH4035228.1 hypothetical protein [candidate division Zixibacteria bacterium]